MYPGHLIRVAVGPNSVWGINIAHEIGGNWQHIPGKLMQVRVVIVGLDIRIVVLPGFCQRIG